MEESFKKNTALSSTSEVGVEPKLMHSLKLPWALKSPLHGQAPAKPAFYLAWFMCPPLLLVLPFRHGIWLWSLKILPESDPQCVPRDLSPTNNSLQREGTSAPWTWRACTRPLNITKGSDGTEVTLVSWRCHALEKQHISPFPCREICSGKYLGIWT